jgi:hypothetical protein
VWLGKVVGLVWLSGVLRFLLSYDVLLAFSRGFFAFGIFSHFWPGEYGC